MTRDELIAALREAKGPDRDLDFKIAVLVGWRYEGPPTRESGPYLWVAPISGRREAVPPWFTASLDAAMTLVPENFRLSELQDLLLGKWLAEVREIHSTAADHSTWKNFEAEAPTGPLALCIAALLAHSQEVGR